MTARRYVHSTFWVDVVAVFPFEVFLVMTSGGTELRRDLIHAALYLRLNRIMQIYRVPLAYMFYVNLELFDILPIFSILLILKIQKNIVSYDELHFKSYSAYYFGTTIVSSVKQLTG